MNLPKHGKPVEILLVEDNAGDVRLTREALADAKVHNNLHVARDGIEALEFLRREQGHEGSPRPDIILLDLNMPRMDGRELLQAIKEDPDLSHIPVVVITTSKAEEDIMRSYKLHANCYITKPVDFEQFLKVVRAIEDFWLTVVRLPSQPT